jgi:hypothetical protein
VLLRMRAWPSSASCLAGFRPSGNFKLCAGTPSHWSYPERNLLHVGSLLTGTEDAVRAAGLRYTMPVPHWGRAGDGIAIMFVFFGLQALYYFVFPPKIITLTETQRKLLGIPVGDYTSSTPP